MQTIPDFVSKYLWDVKIEDVSLETNSKFIIERVLEYGDTDSINWLKSTYSQETISNALAKSRRISPKTGNFYALIFGLDKSKLECICKPFTKKQERF
jgi:hypothetical protein